MTAGVRVVLGIVLGAAIFITAPDVVLASHGTDHQVVVGAPHGGQITSAPGQHHVPYGGDWSMDLATGAGTPVRVRLSHASGSLSLTVRSVRSACAAGIAYGGRLVEVGVTVGGAYLGWILYSHLNPSVSVGQSLSVGQQIGTLWNGNPPNENCWTGPHVHVELRNERHYACLVPRGTGSSISDNTALGVLGGQWRDSRNQSCPGGVVGTMNPFGNFESASAPAARQVRVRGWTIDASRQGRTNSNNVHIYIGGRAGTSGAVGTNIGRASARRDDVARAYSWAGPNHGFSVTVPTSKSGQQEVCAYGINVGVGSNTLLGCRTVTIPVAHALTVVRRGTGGGTVTSSPVGIACGDDCSEPFTEGADVTLTAAAATGSTFTDWSGACTGSIKTCIVSMDVAKTVVARFGANCVVPALRGKTLRTARTLLARAYCTLGRVTRAYSSTVRKGRVISQSPRAGRQLAPNGRVSVKVSRGRQP